MMKRLMMTGLAVAIGAGLTGCYVEDRDPAPAGGGGGTTVIERERVIEKDKESDTHRTDVHINTAPGTTTNHSTTTTTTEEEQRR